MFRKMGLSSLQLDASWLFVVAEFFTGGEIAGITQPALPNGSKTLRQSFRHSVHPRSKGDTAHETAQKLLAMAGRDSLEGEFLSELQTSDKKELAGIVRIAAYSSVLRSVIVPVLAPLLREHPRVRLEVAKAPR